MSDPFKKKFKIPIFEAEVTLIVADHIVDMILLEDKEANAEANAETKAYTATKWPCAKILIRSKDLTHNTICHEVDHITHWLMREIGVQETETSEEAYAYVSGFIMEQVMKLLRKGKLEVIE